MKVTVKSNIKSLGSTQKISNEYYKNMFPCLNWLPELAHIVEAGPEVEGDSFDMFCICVFVMYLFVFLLMLALGWRETHLTCLDLDSLAKSMKQGEQ